MKEILAHKQFEGSVEYSSDDHLFYGKILKTKDLISYEGKNVEKLKTAFKIAVEDYLNILEEISL